MKKIKLSVRKLVEFVLRCGDINSRYAEPSLMNEGAAIHRKIQKEMDETYKSEVSLNMSLTVSETEVFLQGRADGIMTRADGSIVIDEIKSTSLPLEEIFLQKELHLGQAKCYAFMLLNKMKNPPESIAVQLTYYQQESGKIQRHLFDYSREEIDSFFYELIEAYGVWIKYERDWKTLRNKTIEGLSFPYGSLRAGQEEFCKSVSETIGRSAKLYAEAPTGIGKTISALYPSVKAVGEGSCDKIFYLTAKTVTRAVAESAVADMAKTGLRFKSITLRAKEKICLCEKAVCASDYCPYARGHFDRINSAVLDILENNDIITPEIVVEYSEKHTVCPHEFALDISLWCDLVIGDYNHVFDPVVYLKRFFNESTNNKDYVFLIDEAHNLAERLRDMYSASFAKSRVTKIKRELKEKNETAAKIRKTANQIDKYFIDARRECLEEEGQPRRASGEPDVVFNTLLSLLGEAAGEWLSAEENNSHPLNEFLLETYFEISNYIMVSELYDSCYKTLLEIDEKDVVQTQLCIDPSVMAAQRMERARASVLFSATLTPPEYYSSVLGGGAEDGRLSLPSPFPQKNLNITVHHGISTKYKNRSASLPQLADAINIVAESKKGNYMVFFPSYDYMRRAYEVFRFNYPRVKTTVQRGGMSETERGEFLKQFECEGEETLVGFCVMGGVFSEGIDLRGERLIGSIIVGVGLPGISFRQDCIKNYFDAMFGCGYDYAYVFPGMNKVLQAAGRVIRSENDKGTVVLIDSRFNTRQYHELFPMHWSHMGFVQNEEELRERLI